MDIPGGYEPLPKDVQDRLNEEHRERVDWESRSLAGKGVKLLQKMFKYNPEDN